MKTATINKTKVKVFEENELREKLKLNQEQIDLIIKYQKSFPELLQKEINGFIISAETLWEQLGKPQGEYGKWFNRKIKPLFIENIDYSRFAKLVGTIKNNNGKEVERHMLTLEVSKHIAMSTGMDKNSLEEVRKIGRIVRDYFILMENTLRNYEEWEKVRQPEKQGFNDMRQCISDWCDRNGYDKNIKLFYTREADMLNTCVSGLKAQDIKVHIGFDDRTTRDHLETERNKALSEIQLLNIHLLNTDMSFEERSEIIKRACNSKYSHLKMVI